MRFAVYESRVLGSMALSAMHALNFTIAVAFKIKFPGGNRHNCGIIVITSAKSEPPRTLDVLNKKHLKFDQGLDFFFGREFEAKTMKTTRKIRKK